jgi:predicted SnoaL-like aldol condensation-catalyzing enzyme
MSLEENKALVRRFNKEAFDDGDLSATERYLAPDFLNHVSGKRGIEDMQRIIRYVRAAFPDGRMEVDQEIAEGDLVVQLITSTATQTGESFTCRGDQLRRPANMFLGKAREPTESSTAR